MSPLFKAIIDLSERQCVWLVGFAVIFSVLTRFMPCNPDQPMWRSGSLTDIIYFFVMPILNRFVYIAFLSAGIYVFFRGLTGETIMNYLKHGYGPAAKLPVWAQAAVVFLVYDVILYWTHRFFHGRTMWRYHAIHHSPTEVDWLSTYRFHPLNVWLTFTLLDVTTLLIGFSPEAVTALVGFNTLYSAMVHANLNWTFGPFRYVFASPVFHRWHHTSQKEGLDKNFAPTFPLLDIVFGTFYMPEGRRPETYGIKGGTVPTNFLSQLIWPFRRKK